MINLANIPGHILTMNAGPNTQCLNKKTCHFYFANNSVKHWPTSIIFGTQHHKKLDIIDCSLAHLTFILLIHYLVKFRSCGLVIYNNEFILGSICTGSEMINLIATNMSNSYYFSQSLTCYSASFFITACAQNFLLQHKHKRWMLMPCANSTFNNARPGVTHSLMMHNFGLLMYDLKMNTNNVKYVTDFQ